MITEDYVSFETAKLLKEKGFDDETMFVYDNEEELLRLSDFGIRDLTNTDCDDYSNWQFPIDNVSSIVSVPTLQRAMKWLRKIHHIFIDVDYSSELGDMPYFTLITNMNTGDYFKGHELPIEKKTYEEAAEAAIKYCLEKLI